MSEVANKAEKSIFSKIIDREIPCEFLHEDNKCVAFDDIAPKAKTHFLVIPKKPIAMMELAEDGDAEVQGGINNRL